MFERLLTKLWAYAKSLEDSKEAGELFDIAMEEFKGKRYRNAFPKMRESAQRGNINAMAILGSMYLLGHGTYENGQEALKWLHKAVDAGHGDSVGVLGMAYATGKAKIPRNIELAKELLSKSAHFGDSQSAKMLKMIEEKGGMFRHD
jgi:hypothetical protein